ncbi:DUF1194 domain-containing protein [Neoroseomonas soli]|uniref:DUF1194 domain-containing protein n=1 Tax=Neoroseomonas soli TaxID=1081025 RepID=A0A9X9WRL6_9PROT|nr:DUF1194 domain-containing protein [Neoroseomonas soli]MBR0669795.1 DUF1194 domain-containing protein [Neoroseomonas soli]
MLPPACLAAVAFLIDASGSISDRHFAIQRDGTAAAFEDPQVIALIEASEGIAVLVGEFGYGATTRVDWSLIRNETEARRFAATVRGLGRVHRMSQTAIGHAIDHARLAHRDAPCTPQLRVIDVSTDGVESLTRIPIEAVRSAASADRITVNVLLLDPNDQVREGLDRFALVTEAEAWLRDNVVTGFLRLAAEPGGYAEAFRRKFLTEIALLPGSVPAVVAPMVDGGMGQREPSDQHGRRPP